VGRIDEGIAGNGKKPSLFIASLSVDEITTLEVIGVSGATEGVELLQLFT